MPTELRWAISDKTKIEELLQKLATLNDFLRELLNNHQQELLKSRNLRTDYQIMQLNERLDQLEEIIASCSVGNASVEVKRDFLSIPSIGSENGNYQVSLSKMANELDKPHLIGLAQFKAFSSAIDTNSLTEQVAQTLDLRQSAREVSSVELSPNDIALGDEESVNNQRVEGWYRKSKHVVGRIWIEWKECEFRLLNGKVEPDPLVLERLKTLVMLLRENRTACQFRATHCLGLFIPHAKDNRIGLVFENPPGTNLETQPISLFELMLDQSQRMASLTSRVALAKSLAECIERLHAVNWLHKGIRSQNILFFRDENMAYDITKPYLSGFDYSRPAQYNEMSEKPPGDPALDLYRHPRAQGDARDQPKNTRFKKQFDIYSLGIVLIEIAYWKPIHAITGFRDLRDVRSSESVKVRGRLLHDGFLEYLESRLGNIIPEVIKTCLEGPSAFGIPDDADEMDVFVGARLQSKFYDLVVQRLQEIKI